MESPPVEKRETMNPIGIDSISRTEQLEIYSEIGGDIH